MTQIYQAVICVLLDVKIVLKKTDWRDFDKPFFARCRNIFRVFLIKDSINKNCFFVKKLCWQIIKAGCWINQYHSIFVLYRTVFNSVIETMYSAIEISQLVYIFLPQNSWKYLSIVYSSMQRLCNMMKLDLRKKYRNNLIWIDNNSIFSHWKYDHILWTVLIEDTLFTNT